MPRSARSSTSPSARSAILTQTCSTRRSRRVASWCYQQLNRTLFRLDVKDTQVGLKVFSRAVVDDVMPLLLVKRFAFDLELLAVGRRSATVAYGSFRSGWSTASRARSCVHGRGSGSVGHVRDLLPSPSPAHVSAQATLAARCIGAAPRFAAARFAAARVVHRRSGDCGHARLPTPRDPRQHRSSGGICRRPAASCSRCWRRSGRPAGNWVTAAVPYFADERVAAVVCPAMAPLATPLRERAAAAVLESRLGTGFRRMRYLPGNVRVVPDDPAESVVIRRACCLAGARCRGRRRSDGCLARRARAPDGLHTRHLDIVDAPAACPPAPSWSRAPRAVAWSRGPPDAGCKRERRDGALPRAGRRCRRRRLASACGRPHQEDRGRCSFSPTPERWLSAERTRPFASDRPLSDWSSRRPSSRLRPRMWASCAASGRVPPSRAPSSSSVAPEAAAGFAPPWPGSR